MPSSHAYHLKFELYSTPDLTATFGHGTGSDSSAHPDTLPSSSVWQPGPNASIFDSLPSQQPSQRSTQSTLPIIQKDVASDGSSRPISTYRRAGKSTSENTTAPYSEVHQITEEYSSQEAGRDWRFGRVHITSFDMESSGSANSGEHRSHNDTHDATADGKAVPAASLGPQLGGAGQETRGRYTLLEQKETDAGWGIVHLYREGGGRSLPVVGGGRVENGNDLESSNGSDGTILCIPAVPSYLTPRDFLGFVGETWSHDVTHYRMVLTSRTNRYMVLLKLRDQSRAKAWRSAFDGRVFNSMEAEICHVAFIKSITIEMPASQRTKQQIEQRPGHPPHRASHSGKETEVLRPFPPPTADLVELPTCPVCLERMDDTAGIMTILCQHVFHCTCLQTWKGSGCPVCRATNPLPSTGGGSGESEHSGRHGHGMSSGGAYDPNNPFSQPFAAGGATNLCSVCDCSDDLWICLICGNVGCGRYKGGHAKDHWKDSMHSFSLELETQHVWDYAGDMWVHRLLRNKGDGKIVELPSRPSRGLRPRRRRRHHSNYHGSRNGNSNGNGNGNENAGSSRRQGDGQDYSDDDGSSGDDGYDEYDEDEEVVPRAKLDSIGFEYTHLLTSQLESQRLYFEELVNKAADKASKAAASADSAVAQTTEAIRELKLLRDAHTTLADTTVPALERDVERERRRADKASELARSLGKSLQDEKRVSEGLMVRIRHVQNQMTTMQEHLAASQAETVELRETNRDLSMFISGQEKLRELEAEGQLEAGEVEEGTASVPEESAKSKGKGKGRRK